MPNDVGQFILSISMVLSTVWIVNKFWACFFERKKVDVVSSLVWLLYSVFQFYFEWHKGDINIGTTVINILLVLLIAVCSFNSGGKSKYFYLLIYFSVGSLIEMFVYFIIKVISIPEESLHTVGAAISKMIIIILVYALSVFWKKKKEATIPNTYYFLLFFISIGSVCIAVNEFYLKDYSVYSVLTISILLLFNVGIFELYMKINEIFISEKERMAYAQQIDAISQSLTVQKKMMEEFHEEKHNLINKIVVLKNTIENNNQDLVVKNLNQIIEARDSTDIISKSGNSTIDAIINFKYAIAQEYGICFRLNIFIPEELPIKECDLGVVVGNAIDNAIDSTKGCRRREKIIAISMGIKKGSWVMRIKNPFEHELRRDRSGNLLSTKEDNHLHGFGLSSIEKIVEKYEGECFVKTETGYFSLTVLMNLRGF